MEVSIIKQKTTAFLEQYKTLASLSFVRSLLKTKDVPWKLFLGVGATKFDARNICLQKPEGKGSN